MTSEHIWSLLENLQEGVVIAETDGTIRYANPAASALLAPASATAEIKRTLAGLPAWPQLLDAPAQIDATLANGRSLRLQSTPHPSADQDFVQIQLIPQASTQAQPNSLLEQLTALTQISSEPDFDKKLQLIVDGLQQLGWNRVGLSLRDENFAPTRIITAGFSAAEQQQVLENLLPSEIWHSLFHEPSLRQHQYGSCYFVPGDSDWSQANLGAILPDETASGHDAVAWHPKDLLCAILTDRKQQKIGLIGLDQPRNGRRPDHVMMQTIELYAQFAASILENALLVSEALTRNREFETLFAASQALSSTLDRDTVLSILGDHMLQAVNADGYIIYSWHGAKQQLVTLRHFARELGNQDEPGIGTAVTPDPDPALQTLIYQQASQRLQIPPFGSSPLPRPGWLLESVPYHCALIPLTVSGQTYGLVQVLKQGTQRNLGDLEMRLLSALANHASTALETALIFEDTYEREHFYNALGNVNMALNYKLDSHHVLNLICREGMRIFNVDGAYIWQIEGPVFYGSAAAGYQADAFIDTKVALTDQKAFVNKLVAERQVQYINRVNDLPNVHFRLPQSEKIKAVLGVPLEQDDNIIGILVLVDTRQAERFNDKHVSWATLFGVQAAIALHNANLVSELRSFNVELDARVAERTRALNEESSRVKILLRITTELSASLDQDRVLNQALSLVNEVVNATQGVILLIDQQSNELIFRASLGDEKVLLEPKGVPSGMMRDQGLAGWMISNRSAVIVPDTQKDPRWVERETSSEHRSALGVPLITNEEVIGVMMLFHREPGAFTMQQLDLVEAAAIQVANAINNASLYQLIFEQADQLGSMLRSEIIQKANLQAILESIADGVIVANSKNVIEMVNLPAAAALGLTRSQLVGRSMNELLGLYSNFDASWIETLTYWSRNADRIEPGTYLANQLEIEDKVLSMHLSPVLSDKQFYGVVSIFRDITKEVEVDRLKSEFVSTVSHELRTPMTSIKGYADLMLMGAAGEMSEGQTRYLEVIKNNADRLHMLVNDLLNISRIETGKTKLDLRPVYLPEVIAEVVDGHLIGRIQHESKPIDVDTELDPQLPLVNADRGRVVQILTNLLDNAFNYTPDYGRITISTQANSDYVYTSVRDTGIGIGQDSITKIFDRFYRAEDASVQKVPGTGLGLAIVQSLIEMHGGSLHVDSELGKGSTFTFSLPLVVEDGAPTTASR